MGADAKIAVDKFSFNPEKAWIDEQTGFLHLEDITSTPAGILPYPEKGGERRYFPPEVLKRDMVKLAYKPIAIVMHPNGDIIDINNVDEHRVGTIKAEITFDGVIHLKGVIEKKEAIKKILDREVNQTSAGYEYWDDEKPGSNGYGDFDTTVIKIDYNHLLITRVGRAGQQSKVGLDTNQEVKIMTQERVLPALNLAGVKLDKETIIFDPEKSKSAVDSYDRRETTLIEGLETANDKIVKLETELTSTKENLEKAKKAADSSYSKKDVSKIVKETIQVDKVVGKLGLDSGNNPIVSETDDLETKKLSVIKTLTPKSYEQLEEKERLDNKVAVDSAFISAVENITLNQEIREIDQKYLEGERQTAGDNNPFFQQQKVDIESAPGFGDMVTYMRMTSN